jgi:hypothetical protein
MNGKQFNNLSDNCSILNYRLINYKLNSIIVHYFNYSLNFFAPSQYFILKLIHFVYNWHLGLFRQLLVGLLHLPLTFTIIRSNDDQLYAQDSTIFQIFPQ